MIALAAVLAGLAGLVLGTLGGGGSVLILPILLYVAGLPIDQAITASLFAVAITSAVGAVGHARSGRVRWHSALVLGVAGMAGSLAGGWVAHYLPPRVLLIGFIAMMLAAAIAMVRRPPIPRGSLITIGIVVGLITGLVGAGGGFVVVPALVLAGGLDFRDAAGTSLVVIALQAAAGFAAHLIHVAVPWPIVIVVTAAAAVGVIAGVRISSLVSPVTLRRSFAALLLAISTVMLTSQLA
jgi:hypothetical protein